MTIDEALAGNVGSVHAARAVLAIEVRRLRDIESVATHIVNHFLAFAPGGPLPPNLFVLRKLLRNEDVSPELLARYQAGPCE